VLPDAFTASFSVESNLNVWKKVGAVPLTRACLSSPLVRYQAVPNANGVIDLTTDPLIAQGMALEDHNKLCCDLLLAEGFDGNQLRIECPKIKASATAVMTEPLSRERQDLIQKSKTAGKLFYATGGQHLNSDDVFMSYEREDRERVIKEQRNEKKRRQELASNEIAARTILDTNEAQLLQRGVESLKVGDLRVLVKWKTKGLVALAGKKKNTLVELWKNALAEQDGATALLWTAADEKALQSLIKDDITIEQTALGRERRQIAQACAIAIENGDLNTESITEIEKAMLKRFTKEAQNDNSSE